MMNAKKNGMAFLHKFFTVGRLLSGGEYDYVWLSSNSQIG